MNSPRTDHGHFLAQITNNDGTPFTPGSILQGAAGVAGTGGELTLAEAGENDAGIATLSGGNGLADKSGGVARVQGGSGNGGGAEAAFAVFEGGQLDGSAGRVEIVGAEIAFTTAAMGFFGTGAVARPEVPASPTAQDVVDALVALGLVTQAV